jgi:hypothetical protein
MKTFRKIGLVAVACMVFSLAAFSPPASATHNRATQLSWSEGAAPGEVIFSIDFVARAGYYGFPAVGDVITDPELSFGDGGWTYPELTVTELDDDVIYTHGQVVHTYADSGPYTARMGSCCRLSSSSGHVNNGDLSYQVHTLVDLAKADSSPSIAVAPVVFCPTSGNCSFAFAGSSADPGNHLRWRFATAAESGEPSFVQPGPPYAPNAATIDPALGRLSWDTAGATMSAEGLPTFYSTQVIAEELNAQDETVSDAAADFFIALDDDHGEQPDCEDTDSNSLVDNDNDGLCDNWEEEGINSDHDDDIDFFLPASADPDVPDVFLEIDYMRDREPQKAAIEAVETAYDKHGIDLHVLVDDEIPFTKYLAFGFDCPGCGSEVSSFDTVKDVYFGTAGDRASPANWTARRDARKFVFHYALYGNELAAEFPSTSGSAELPGNDFAVTLGNPVYRPVTGTFFEEEHPPKVRDEAGTLMHELGHNLALWHGGGENVNCKPNYLSVMNYSRQMTGYIGAQLDYSDAVLPSLDENSLNEFLGVQGPGGAQVVHGPGPFRVSNSTGSIDWNGVGGFQASVSADVNHVSDRGSCKSSPSPGETLVGFDDWENLSLPFQATADFADGVHSTLFLQEPELAGEDFAGVDSDGDGVDNIEDRCTEVAGSVTDLGCPAAGLGPPPPSAAASTRPAAAPARPGAPDTKLGKARIRAKAGGARFTFSGSGGAPVLGFQCKLDRRPFKPCRSPKAYAGLKAGAHVFRVRAVDSLGQLDPAPVVKRFRIG